MASIELRSRALFRSLLVLSCLQLVAGMSGWAGCLDGQDVFVTIKENSVYGKVVAELVADVSMEGVQWKLEGKDVDWFFLEEGDIRLNTSADKILDRELLGPVLMAQLSCYEEDTLQSVFRIMVEIINDNDNSPVFVENTVRSLTISELSPVDVVVFTVQAMDGDNDSIIYSIDQASPDAEYFNIVLPNSGEVVLAKPLDYETKTQLTLTIYATEMSTAEHFNTSTNITITVTDGDDQYPYFLPCVLLFEDETNRICTSPTYTANVTEGEQDIVLDFFPGPIHAEDGDKGLSSPVSYAVLSGDDQGHFRMNRQTGEVTLTEMVTDRLTYPVFYLQIMAYQDNDPRKYSLATVVVRVLPVNNFNPEFDLPEYDGFVTAGKGPVSLVNTYGNNALILHAHDQDFNQSLNPMIYFTFSPASGHTDIYQVTHEGLLIARQSQLQPREKHVLEVMAVDEETGDATFATVVVEVLSEGQSIPHSPPAEGRLTGCTVGKALFLSMVFMSAIGCIAWMIMWLKKKYKGRRDPLERGCVAQGKHPNVSLRWFQLVSHGCPHMDEVAFNNEEYGTCNPSFSFPDKQSLYSHRETPTSIGSIPPGASFTTSDTVCSSVLYIASDSKSSCNLSTCSPVALDVSPSFMAPDDEAAKENDLSRQAATPDTMETRSLTNPSPADYDANITPPLTRPNSQATTNDDHVDPVTSPSSQCSVPFSRARIASAEIDKPFRKPRVKTPPYSPLLSSSLPKQTSTPPPTPEHAPLKATLVHIDTTPPDTPPETRRTSETLSIEENQPSTSLDQLDQPEPPEVPADAESPSQDRRLSAISANTQDGRAEEDDDGFLGDEDADKNSEGEGTVNDAADDREWSR